MSPEACGTSSGTLDRSGPTGAAVWAMRANGTGPPLLFFGAGLVSLAILPLGILLRPEVLTTYHYNHFVIALTHLTVLGWMGSALFGALYLLVPVAMGTRLYSEPLARWHWLCHLLGTAGMVWMFWRWDPKQVGHFGSVLAVGLGLGLWSLGRTLLRASGCLLVRATVALTLFWWIAAVTVGLGLAAAKCTYESAAQLDAIPILGAMVRGLEGTALYLRRFDPLALMHAHAHLGLLGAFLLPWMGLSYGLLTAFRSVPPLPSVRFVVVLALWNGVVIGSFFSILHRSSWKMVFTLLGVATVGFYGTELIRLWRRVRPVLDLPQLYLLTGLLWFFPLSGLAVYLSLPGLNLTTQVGQWENVYGLWGLLGLFTFSLLGMLYKIVPYLAWQRRYAPWLGLSPVPPPHELCSAAWLRTGYGLHWLAMAGWTLGTLLQHGAAVRAGAGVFLAAVVCHAYNLTRWWLHRPSSALVKRARAESIRMRTSQRQRPDSETRCGS